jgi:hypothetical protein
MVRVMKNTLSLLQMLLICALVAMFAGAHASPDFPPQTVVHPADAR